MKYAMFSLVILSSLSSFAGTSYFSTHCKSTSGTIVQLATEVGNDSLKVYKQSDKKTELILDVDSYKGDKISFLDFVDYKKQLLSFSASLPKTSSGLEEFALIATPNTIKAVATKDSHLKKVTFEASFVTKKSEFDKPTVEKLSCVGEDFLENYL